MEVPALQVDANSSDHEATDATLAETPTARRPLGILASWIQSTSEELLFYFHHPVFIPSISLSLLYFTVLSFSGQMVTYLLTVGYDSAHIGLIRTVSVLFEMSATWIAPRVMAKIGPIRGAIWFISWQTLCVSAGLCFFWGAPIPLVAAAGLVGGVIASRIGLWGFDMCVQLIIQEVSLWRIANPKFRLILFYRLSSTRRESSPIIAAPSLLSRPRFRISSSSARTLRRWSLRGRSSSAIRC